MKLSKYARKIKGRRICIKKIQYGTRDIAWKFSFQLFKKLGNFQTPYSCRHCGFFHLTAKQATQASDVFVEGLADWFSVPLEDFKKILHE